MMKPLLHDLHVYKPTGLGSGFKLKNTLIF